MTRRETIGKREPHRRCPFLPLAMIASVGSYRLEVPIGGFVVASFLKWLAEGFGDVEAIVFCFTQARLHAKETIPRLGPYLEMALKNHCATVAGHTGSYLSFIWGS